MENMWNIKQLLSNIHIHNLTYAVMLVAFLSGYFSYMFILLFMITVHEIGHLYTAHLLKFDVDKIIIYPFGGITKYNALLNSSIIKEILILLSGPLFQFIFFLVIHFFYINNYVNPTTYETVKTIHYYLLIFNFLPIIPLDGSKLLNLTLEFFFSYKKANIITIVISIVTILVSITYNFKLLFIFLAILLIKSVIIEIKTHKLKVNKFLVERLIYKFNFKEGKIINNIYKIKRGKTHKIKENGKIYNELEYLEKLFDLGK